MEEEDIFRWDDGGNRSTWSSKTCKVAFRYQYCLWTTVTYAYILLQLLLHQLHYQTHLLRLHSSVFYLQCASAEKTSPCDHLGMNWDQFTKEILQSCLVPFMSCLPGCDTGHSSGSVEVHRMGGIWFGELSGTNTIEIKMKIKNTTNIDEVTSP